MSSDSGARQPGPARPDFEVPDLVDVKVRRTTFRPRDHRNFRSALPVQRDAVEFTVRTDRPFPVRALGPALYVGAAAVVECEAVELTLYRFVAFDPAALRRGAPIRLGWSGRAPAAERK